MVRSYLWVWLPELREWVEASWHAGCRLAIDEGFEAAYGCYPPDRQGVSHRNTPRLWRVHAWVNFIDAVAAVPGGRHRLGTFTALN